MAAKPKKKLSATTIRKMRMVIAAVKAEPSYLNQNCFPRRYDCGLTCCGAGWAVWLFRPALFRNLVKSDYTNRGPVMGWAGEAEKVLGLPYTGNQLFASAGSWPYSFYEQYLDANDARGRAAAFAARWEEFIATDGEV